MEAVTTDEFFRWAAEVGVGLDPRYPASGCLSLLPPSEHARFWELPLDPATWPHFSASLLGCLDNWDVGYLWPRAGRWPKSADDLSLNEGIRAVVLRGAGIPPGEAAAVRVRQADLHELAAILYVYLAFGWCTDDDLFFVPDHGRQLVQTDHHDVVHVKCRAEGRVMDLVERMSRAGYELPTELPDETFKRPAWMGSGGRIAEPDRTPDRGGDK